MDGRLRVGVSATLFMTALGFSPAVLGDGDPPRDGGQPPVAAPASKGEEPKKPEEPGKEGEPKKEGEARNDGAPREDKDKPPALSDAQRAEGLAAYAALSAPGLFHRNLEPLVGEFVGASKFWPAADDEPAASQATFTRKWVLGGRFIMEEHEGSIMTMPFSSLGILGYDTMKKRYVATWCDTMSTGIEFMEGECDAAGKTIAFHDVYENPAAKTRQSFRYIFRIESPARHVIEMWTVGADGKEFRTLETVCTRK